MIYIPGNLCDTEILCPYYFKCQYEGLATVLTFNCGTSNLKVAVTIVHIYLYNIGLYVVRLH